MTTIADVTSPSAAPPRPSSPVRRVAELGVVSRARAEGVTGPAVVGLGVLLVGVGVLVDLPGEPRLGVGSGLAVLLAALVGPSVVRLRAMATALVLPPLLLAGAATALGRLGGRNRGTRELVLDVATTLALAAPLLFAATGLAMLIGLARIVWHRWFRHRSFRRS